jgi:hypothetical protein
MGKQRINKGEQVKKEEKRRVVILLDPEDYEKLEAIAHSRRLKPAQVVREYIIQEMFYEYKKLQRQTIE